MKVPTLVQRCCCSFVVVVAWVVWLLWRGWCGCCCGVGGGVVVLWFCGCCSVRGVVVVVGCRCFMSVWLGG